jgi:signal transduction histidine kinase
MSFYMGGTRMNKMCIRNKVLVILSGLLIVDLGIVILLERRVERELDTINAAYQEFVTHRTAPDYILTGDMSGTFILKREYLPEQRAVGMPGISDVLFRFRNQIFVVFGITLCIGAVLFLIAMRSSAKSVMQVVNGTLLKDGASGSSMPPIRYCAMVQKMRESLQSIRQDLKQNEEEKSRLENVELTKRLAAGVAHEIKNPINTVGLIVDHIQSNLSPDDPEKRYEFYKLTENLKQELKRINRTVEGFLRLTRPKAYTFQKVNLNGIIEHVLTTFEPELAKNGIEMQLDLSDRLPPVDADEDRLRQVFANLILNSIEALPRGGVVTFNTYPGENGFVEVRVIDNGIGISEEHVEDVFNPYYTTKKQGFGLGLSLIQDIIHNHKGKISLMSRRGVGTEFTIILPVDVYHEQKNSRR